MLLKMLILCYCLFHLVRKKLNVFLSGIALAFNWWLLNCKSNDTFELKRIIMSQQVIQIEKFILSERTDEEEIIPNAEKHVKKHFYITKMQMRKMVEYQKTNAKAIDPKPLEIYETQSTLNQVYCRTARQVLKDLPVENLMKQNMYPLKLISHLVPKLSNYVLNTRVICVQQL